MAEPLPAKLIRLAALTVALGLLSPISALAQARRPDPDFNRCAIEYNAGKMADALTDCDKAIAADPARADAYFIKGSILFGDGTLVGAKWVAKPGALEALRKYLELAPDGPHATDVAQMLDAAK
jgi:tetratricopeptide (TPR) repeat protein